MRSYDFLKKYQWPNVHCTRMIRVQSRRLANSAVLISGPTSSRPHCGNELESTIATSTPPPVNNRDQHPPPPPVNNRDQHPPQCANYTTVLRGSWGGGGGAMRPDRRGGGAMRCESNTHRTRRLTGGGRCDARETRTGPTTDGGGGDLLGHSRSILGHVPQ